MVNLNRQRVVNLLRRELIISSAQGWSIWIGGDWSIRLVYPLNQAFAVELHDFIERSGIEYWLFGHHHQDIADFKIGTTKMITNQLGYVKYNENIGFDNGRTIEM